MQYAGLARPQRWAEGPGFPESQGLPLARLRLALCLGHFGGPLITNSVSGPRGYNPLQEPPGPP